MNPAGSGKLYSLGAVRFPSLTMPRTCTVGFCLFKRLFQEFFLKSSRSPLTPDDEDIESGPQVERETITFGFLFG